MPWECDGGGNWSDDGTKLSASGTLASFCAQNVCEGEGVGFVSVYVQGELIQLPYHINPNYNSPEQLYPWEAPGDVLYAEHGVLHPSKHKGDSSAQMWFGQIWRPEGIGILQTMINRAESATWKVSTPTEAALSSSTDSRQYAYPGRNVEDLAWQESYALSFEVNMMGTRIDQPYTYFAHQDLNEIRGYIDDRNGRIFNNEGEVIRICCNERTAFGPTSGWKDYYVGYYMTLGKGAQ